MRQQGSVMDKAEMIQKLRELDAKIATEYPIVDGTTKTGIGFGATFASMSINDWMGLAVGLATFMYMCLQIEAAWRRRKTDKE